MNDLTTKIEALLFALGRPLSHTELAQKLDATEDDIKNALSNAPEEGRGVVLVNDGRMVELRTTASMSELVSQVRKDEYSRDIGRAGLETLSAIVYRGPLTRSEVDFIRGVNSSQTLRTLAMRGLVRKVPNPRDERSFLYEPTTELLAHLGVAHVDELPEFKEVRSKLEALERAYREKENSDA